MTALIILFILLCLVQLFLIIVYRKPNKILHYKLATKSGMRSLKIALYIVMIVLYILFFMQLDNYHKPQPLDNKPYLKQTVYPTVQPDLVQQLGARQTASITNLYFLYLGKDKSLQKLATIALQLRHQYCISLCIVNLYDDKTAFAKDIERVTITANTDMEAWNKKNYVFVADHYLGYLDAIANAQFVYYPFHDGYYKRAKAGTTAGY